jgi:HEPN domain-containing protein
MGVEPLRVHDLDRVARQHPALELALAGHLEALGVLTDYEAGSRYPPGIWVTVDEAHEAVRVAEEVRTIVLGLLGLDPASWCGAGAAPSV